MEKFFNQIIQFVNEVQRQFGTATERYTLYVVERLEVCVSSVRQLKDHLTRLSGTSGVQPDVIQLVNEYIHSLQELIQCLEALSVQWTAYSDRVGNPDISSAYRASTDGSGQIGRPPLHITQTQLENLC